MKSLSWTRSNIVTPSKHQTANSTSTTTGYSVSTASSLKFVRQPNSNPPTLSMASSVPVSSSSSESSTSHSNPNHSSHQGRPSALCFRRPSIADATTAPSSLVSTVAVSSPLPVSFPNGSLPSTTVLSAPKMSSSPSSGVLQKRFTGHVRQLIRVMHQAHSTSPASVNRLMKIHRSPSVPTSPSSSNPHCQLSSPAEVSAFAHASKTSKPHAAGSIHRFKASLTWRSLSSTATQMVLATPTPNSSSPPASSSTSSTSSHSTSSATPFKKYRLPNSLTYRRMVLSSIISSQQKPNSTSASSVSPSSSEAPVIIATSKSSISMRKHSPAVRASSSSAAFSSNASYFPSNQRPQKAVRPRMTSSLKFDRRSTIPCPHWQRRGHCPLHQPPHEQHDSSMYQQPMSSSSSSSTPSSKCPFKHDPADKPLCRAFIRGNCHRPNCHLSHHITRERMPVCSKFLRGLCFDGEQCLYSHVRVSRDAPPCPEFASGGVCPRGTECKLKHVFAPGPSSSSSSSSSTASSSVKSALVFRLHQRPQSKRVNSSSLSFSSGNGSSLTSKRPKLSSASLNFASSAETTKSSSALLDSFSSLSSKFPLSSSSESTDMVSSAQVCIHASASNELFAMQESNLNGEPANIASSSSTLPPLTLPQIQLKPSILPSFLRPKSVA